MRKALFAVSGLGLLGLVVLLVVMRPLSSDAPPMSPSASSNLDAAWRRVLEAPRDPEAWAALGDAQGAEDELDGAEHAYRTAVRLGGGDGLAFARLGFLLYQKGELLDALALLKEARRRSVDVPMLDYTIETIEAETGGAGERAVRGLAPIEPSADAVPSIGPDAAVAARYETDLDAGYVDAWTPEPPASAPTCTIELERSSDRGIYLVDVVFEGVAGRLVVDTGASMTVLSADYLQRLGIAEDHEHTIRAMTANGQAVFPTAIVSRLTVAGRVLDESRVAICSECVEGLSDGLFGLDLQAAFGLQLDLGRGVLRLSDCE